MEPLDDRSIFLRVLDAVNNTSEEYIKIKLIEAFNKVIDNDNNEDNISFEEDMDNCFDYLEKKYSQEKEKEVERGNKKNKSERNAGDFINEISNRLNLENRDSPGDMSSKSSVSTVKKEDIIDDIFDDSDIWKKRKEAHRLYDIRDDLLSAIREEGPSNKSYNRDEPSLVTPLSKYKIKERNGILKNIHNRARQNILDITDENASDFEDQVSKEADRLLDSWMKYEKK
jgi:hypothetical protein